MQGMYNLTMALEDTHRHKIDILRQGIGKSEKIDWYHQSHTHFSMKKIGVFPIGTKKDIILKEVSGTFGGRFESFNDTAGTFIYIAYTD